MDIYTWIALLILAILMTGFWTVAARDWFVRLMFLGLFIWNVIELDHILLGITN